ncbi:MAG: hypothetical protein WCS96_09945 [Victivallales bacterium]
MRKTPTGTEVSLEKNIHSILWRDFIDASTSMIYDYNDASRRENLPTPEEVNMEIPNPAGWMCGFEDCCLNGSMYLAGLIEEYNMTGSDRVRERARKISGGLIHLANVSKTRGFLARGVLPDRKTHYPNSSVDQYTMWMYAMWRYFFSGVASGEDKRKITGSAENILNFLEAGKFNILREDMRESIFGNIDNPESRNRLLFFLKAGYAITGNQKWNDIYKMKRDENDSLALKCLCEKGLLQHGIIYGIFQDQVALRCLYELSDDFREKTVYEKAMKIRAETVDQSINRFEKLRDAGISPEKNFNWRGDLDEFIRKYPGTEKALKGRHIFELVGYWYSKRPVHKKITNQLREPVEALVVQLLSNETGMCEKHRKTFSDILTWDKYGKASSSAMLAYIPLMYWLERKDERIFGADLGNGEFKKTDMKKHCNVGFQDGDGKSGWFACGAGDDMRDIRRGAQVFGKVPFHIITDEENDGRACVILKGNASPLDQPPYLDGAHGIAINSYAKYIFFLHTMSCEAKHCSGYYRIVYEDSSEISVPLAYGENIMPWKLHEKNWKLPTNTLEAIGVRVSQPPRQSVAEIDQEVFIYVWRWINPKCYLKIDHVDFVRAENGGVPVLIAATLFKKK